MQFSKLNVNKIYERYPLTKIWLLHLNRQKYHTGARKSRRINTEICFLLVLFFFCRVFYLIQIKVYTVNILYFALSVLQNELRYNYVYLDYMLTFLLLFLTWIVRSVVIKQQTTVSDKVKHRVEQLDDIEEVKD